MSPETLTAARPSETPARPASEPWVFLVGADGRVKAKFEGSVSAAELASAVRAKLL